jgi:hypothetical protein
VSVSTKTQSAATFIVLRCAISPGFFMHVYWGTHYLLSPVADKGGAYQFNEKRFEAANLATVKTSTGMPAIDGSYEITIENRVVPVFPFVKGIGKATLIALIHAKPDSDPEQPESVRYAVHDVRASRYRARITHFV